jgi:predicted transcriptional regulator
MTDEIQKLLQYVDRSQPTSVYLLARFAGKSEQDMRDDVRHLEELRLLRATPEGVRTTDRWWARLRQLNEHAVYESLLP